MAVIDFSAVGKDLRTAQVGASSLNGGEFVFPYRLLLVFLRCFNLGCLNRDGAKLLHIGQGDGTGLVHGIIVTQQVRQRIGILLAPDHEAAVLAVFPAAFLLEELGNCAPFLVSDITAGIDTEHIERLSCLCGVLGGFNGDGIGGWCCRLLLCCGGLAFRTEVVSLVHDTLREVFERHFNSTTESAVVDFCEESSRAFLKEFNFFLAVLSSLPVNVIG